MPLQVTSVINNCLQSSPESASSNDRIAFHIQKEVGKKPPNFLRCYFCVGHLGCRRLVGSFLAWGLSGLVLFFFFFVEVKSLKSTA